MLHEWYFQKRSHVWTTIVLSSQSYRSPMKEKSAIWDAVRPSNRTDRYVCVCCDLEYVATASRIEQHLTGGSKGGIRACPYPERAPPTVSAFIEKRAKSYTSKRSRGNSHSQASVAQLFGEDRTRATDLAISEFIYGCGLPPSIVRSDYFKNMVKSLQHAAIGYMPPSSETLRTKLLKDTKERCDVAVHPLRSEHALTGCTLCCDEWSNVRHESVINFLLVSPGGALFEKAAECSKETKTGEWIAEQIDAVIQEVGPSKVVQVRTCRVQLSISRQQQNETR